MTKCYCLLLSIAVLFQTELGLAQQIPQQSLSLFQNKPLKAFPSAEGFGRFATGGRNGVVVRVTSLADSGDGTLREALTKDVGPRIVIFDTGGIITLKRGIKISEPNITIAGQTAPGDGILIRGGRLSVRANNVIIRGLRLRVGYGLNDQPITQLDGISIGNSLEPSRVEHVVVANNSISWASDENTAMWSKDNGGPPPGVKNITFQDNIIAEALGDPEQSGNDHSMGMLIGDETSNLTTLRNIFSGNIDRNPVQKK